MNFQNVSNRAITGSIAFRKQDQGKVRKRVQWVQVFTFGKQTLDWCFALFETGSKLWANRGWLIYLRTARRQKTCCVSSEIWGCRKFFHRKDTFVCFFLTGGPLVTNNSWLRMITVSEIVRICQTSNYLLDINWSPSRTCKTQWSQTNDNDSYS